TLGEQGSRGRSRPSVRLRPEVDEPDRLHAPRAHLVELPDALRLAREITAELIESVPPGAHVGLDLALLLLVEVECQLVELPFVPRQLLADALALALEGLAQVLRFLLAALAEPLDRQL